MEGGGIREACSGAVGLLCTVCSETSAYYNFNQTPGKYPKEYIQCNLFNLIVSVIVGFLTIA